MKYDAFISYRHTEPDYQVACRLQKLLERMKIEDPESGKKRNLVIFRDESELPTSDNLGNDIENALANSRFLILVCSKEFVKSRWCMREISYFKSLHGDTNAHILPLLIDGEPEESFPKTLRTEKRIMVSSSGEPVEVIREVEPLAADIRHPKLTMMLRKLSKTEYLRILAPILHTSFDGLYQRRRKEMLRLALLGSTVALLLTSAFLLYNMRMRQNILESRDSLLLAESDRIANLASEASAAGDYKLSLLLSMQSLDTLSQTKEGAGESAEAAGQLRSNVFYLDEISSEKYYAYTQCIIRKNSDSYLDIIRYFPNLNAVAVKLNRSIALFDCLTGNEISRLPGFLRYYLSNNGTVCVSMQLDKVVGYNFLEGKILFTYDITHNANNLTECLIDPETNDSYIFSVPDDDAPWECIAVFGADGTQKEFTGFSPSVQKEYERVKSSKYYPNYLEDNWVSVWDSEDKSALLASQKELIDDYQCFLRRDNPHPILKDGDNYYIFADPECKDYVMYQNVCVLGACGEDVLLAVQPEEDIFGIRIIRVTFAGYECLDKSARAAETHFEGVSKIHIIQHYDSFFEVFSAKNRDAQIYRSYEDEKYVLNLFQDGMEQPDFSQAVNMQDFGTYIFQTEPDLRHMVFGCNTTLHVWSFQNGFEMERDMGSYVNCVAIRPDGEYIAAALGPEGESAQVAVIQMSSGKEIARLTIPNPVKHMEIVGSYMIIVTSQNESLSIPEYYVYQVKNTSVEFLSNLDNPIHAPSGCCIRNSIMPVMLTQDGILMPYYIFEWWQLSEIYDLKTGNRIFDTPCDAALYNPESRCFVYQSGNFWQTSANNNDISVVRFNPKTRKMDHLYDLLQAGALFASENDLTELRQYMTNKYFQAYTWNNNSVVFDFETGNTYFSAVDSTYIKFNHDKIYWEDRDVSALALPELVQLAEQYLTSEFGMRVLSQYEKTLYHIK